MSSETSVRGFFRCPHCRQKTITAWAKLRTRGACPGCQGRFVAGSWGILLASLAMPFAMFAPMLFLFQFHPIGFPLYWLVFAAGAVLAIALAAAIYLFTTPLYRKGSAGARWDAISFFAGIAAITIVAIGNTGFDREAGLAPGEFTAFRIGATVPPRRDADIAALVSYSDAARQQALKDALDKAGIPYKLETRKDGEFIGWTRANEAAARAIQRQVDGSELPPRSSVSFDNPALQQEFSAWLTAKGLKNETKSAHGREFVVWDGPDNLSHQFMLQRPSVPCDKTAAADGTGKKKC